MIEGATENAAVVQALIDNLIERGLDPTVCRLFIIDGAKALSKAIRKTFGRHTPIQRCQVHKARNIIERLAKPLHASRPQGAASGLGTRRCREGGEADPQSRPRLEREAPGVSASILEGIDEILTVTRLGLPVELRRSLACTNIIENMNGTVRHVCRNVKRWRCRDGAALDRCRHARSRQGLPPAQGPQAASSLRAALDAHHNKDSHSVLARQPSLLNINLSNDRFYVHKRRDIARLARTSANYPKQFRTVAPRSAACDGGPQLAASPR